MVPPAAMLATKNRAGCYAILCVALAMVVLGCVPAGPRALLDGKQLLEDGKHDLAVAKLKIATTLLKTNAQAWNYFGVACHRAGQLTNAVAAYQRALDLNRDLLEARYNLGCVWLDLNKPELAKAEFTSYTLRRGHQAEGWLKLGTAQLRARELAAAEKSFREAMRLNQNSTEAMNGLGLVQLQRNRPREAVQYFETALKQQPDYRPALLNLAIVSQQSLNDRASALQKYRAYLALKPRAADWEQVNALARDLGQPMAAPAGAAATNLVTLPPATVATNAAKPATPTAGPSPPPKTNAPPTPRKTEPTPQTKAETTRPVSQPVTVPPAAQTAAVEVVTLPPEPVIKTAAATDNVPPNASSDISAGQSSPVSPTPVARKDNARGFLLPDSAATQAQGTVTSAPQGQRYVYLSPPKPAAGNRREAERAFAQGQQAHRANRLAEAAQAFRQATQADPGYFEAYYNLGLVTFESKSFRQSLSAWETALAIQPDSVDARYNFALALKAANYPVDAAIELKQILAANANETRAHLVLGNLFADPFGDTTQARVHYLKVLEQDPRHPQATAIRYWLVAHPP
jgi:tetratricopeptide (TPR) repeat protein